MFEFDTTEIEKKAKEKLNAGLDVGHNELMADVTDLLEEAVNFSYHDFVSEKHATPKMALVTKLQSMIKACQEGKYDN